MKKKIFYIAAASFLILYYFLIPRPLGRELVVKPHSLIVPEDLGIREAAQGKFPLELKDYIGYLDAEYLLSSLYLTETFSTASSEYFIQFNTEDPSRTIMTPNGDVHASVRTPGIPFYSGDRLFFYESDTNYLEERDNKGKVLWRRNTGNLITSFNATSELAVLGLADGVVRLFAKDGTILEEYRPGGSRIEIIYGVALSHNNRYICLISGLDPQRLVILEKRENGYRPLDYYELQDQLRRSTSIQFSEDDTRVYVDTANTITVYDFYNKNFYQLPHSSNFTSLYQYDYMSNIALMNTEDNQRELIILTDKNNLFLKTQFPAEHARLKMMDDHFYIVVDNTVLIYSLLED